MYVLFGGKDGIGDKSTKVYFILK